MSRYLLTLSFIFQTNNKIFKPNLNFCNVSKYLYKKYINTQNVRPQNCILCYIQYIIVHPLQKHPVVDNACFNLLCASPSRLKHTQCEIIRRQNVPYATHSDNLHVKRNIHVRKHEAQKVRALGVCAQKLPDLKRRDARRYVLTRYKACYTNNKER